MFSGQNKFNALLESLAPMENGSTVLPEKLHLYIKTAVREKCFEIFAPLYTIIKEEWSDKINVDCVLNAILATACENYNEVEFDELIQDIPSFDMNRHIAPHQSLLCTAALQQNIRLVTLLTERYHCKVDQHLLDAIRQDPSYSTEDSKLPYIKAFLETAYYQHENTMGAIKHA